MKRYLGLSAGMVMAAGTLTGCGGGTEEYCNSLEDATSQFDSLEGGSPEDFGDAVATFRELGDDAPDEVSEDWEVLNKTFDDMEAALEDAGLSFDDLGTLTSGELPEGVDPADVESLSATFEEMNSDAVQQAGDDIEAHAQEECDIDLSS
jgi:hypothetical protein